MTSSRPRLNLIQRNSKIMANIQTVLIDEFQDTNTVQFALVQSMAKAQGSLTIVGDPDQSSSPPFPLRVFFGSRN